MNYNEPIRPRGIGRKQVAFPTGSQYTELQDDEALFLETSQISSLHESEAAAARAVGIAKSASTAAASTALQQAQNFPFEIRNITNFAISGSGTGTFAAIPFDQVIIENTNFFYDSRDRNIYVNDAGWYFVRAFFYSTAIQGNYDWGLRVVTNVGNASYTESYNQFIDIRNSNKHPNVAGTTIINLPNQSELLNTAGRYGFRVDLYTTATFVSFLQGNTQCSLQIFKLADIFESERKYFENLPQ
ncbi:MAG: hypothetical protein ACKODS_07960 [Methylophilaceae bacterium]